MSAPYNGIATAITIQRETTLGQSSTEPVYSLAGQISFRQSVEFIGRGKTVNVWREENTGHHAGQFYAGSFELELGLNQVIELLLYAFFEVETASQYGGMLFGEWGDIFGEGAPILGEGESGTNSVLRPARLNAVKSLKIGLDFPGESILLQGLVIDQLAFDIRRNQVPKLAVQFKAISRSVVSAPALAGALTKEVRRVHHVNSSITLDAAALFLTEANLTFNQRKTPGGYGTDKIATRFAVDPFVMTGQLVEYFAANAKLPAAVVDQNEHVFFLALNDPNGVTRKLEFYWPRVLFNDAMPDALGREDLICRASMSGLNDLGHDAAGPKIVLVA